LKQACSGIIVPFLGHLAHLDHGEQPVSIAPAPIPQPVIYVIDDDEALRDSLAWLLESSGRKVETHASGEAFLEAWHLGLSGCILLDVRMPGMSGLELFEQLQSRHCELPVIFMTGHGDVPMAVSALKKGAADFIEKPFNNETLLALIADHLESARRVQEKRDHDARIAQRMALLTSREHEVLALIVAGKLNKQIADILGISIKTVEVHRSRVMEKMQVRSLAELVKAVVACQNLGSSDAY
jgi:FixJ family two-component response regulator